MRVTSDTTLFFDASLLAAAEAVQKPNLPIRILTPGDFIQQHYPLHEAYSSLPSPRGSDSESGRATG